MFSILLTLKRTCTFVSPTTSWPLTRFHLLWNPWFLLFKSDHSGFFFKLQIQILYEGISPPYRVQKDRIKKRLSVFKRERGSESYTKRTVGLSAGSRRWGNRNTDLLWDDPTPLWPGIPFPGLDRPGGAVATKVGLVFLFGSESRCGYRRQCLRLKLQNVLRLYCTCIGNYLTLIPLPWFRLIESLSSDKWATLSKKTSQNLSVSTGVTDSIRCNLTFSPSKNKLSLSQVTNKR